MTGLPDLRAINWHSDECECRVEVRQYVIGRDAGHLWCFLRRLDGTAEQIPMRDTTIDEMVASGLQPDYWLAAQRRQRERIAKIEQAISDQHEGIPLAWVRNDPTLEGLPQAPGLWRAYLENARIGRTTVDHDGYRRSPGTQLRGHLSHRCARHGNQTSTSLMSQIAHYVCGCQIREITVGERREHGVTHRNIVRLCPTHARNGLPSLLRDMEAA